MILPDAEAVFNEKCKASVADSCDLPPELVHVVFEFVPLRETVYTYKEHQLGLYSYYYHQLMYKIWLKLEKPFLRMNSKWEQRIFTYLILEFVSIFFHYVGITCILYLIIANLGSIKSDWNRFQSFMFMLHYLMPGGIVVLVVSIPQKFEKEFKNQ